MRTDPSAVARGRRRTRVRRRVRGTDEAPELPRRRDAWHLTLGDLDFF